MIFPQHFYLIVVVWLVLLMTFADTAQVGAFQDWDLEVLNCCPAHALQDRVSEVPNCCPAHAPQDWVLEVPNCCPALAPQDWDSEVLNCCPALAPQDRVLEVPNCCPAHAPQDLESDMNSCCIVTQVGISHVRSSSYAAYLYSKVIDEHSTVQMKHEPPLSFYS